MVKNRGYGKLAFHGAVDMRELDTTSREWTERAQFVDKKTQNPAESSHVARKGIADPHFTAR